MVLSEDTKVNWKAYLHSLNLTCDLLAVVDLLSVFLFDLVADEGSLLIVTCLARVL